MVGSYGLRGQVSDSTWMYKIYKGIKDVYNWL